MKSILFIFAAIFSLSVSAQNTTPSIGTYSGYSQMWNPASYYYNSVTKASQLGSQLDTITNTGSVYEKSANFFYSGIYTLPGSPNGISTIVQTDTVIVAPVEGYGAVTLTASVLKCTGTATVNCIPVSSSDGVIWSAIPPSNFYSGSSGATLSVAVTPSSLTVPVVTKWTFPVKPDKYLGVEFTGVGTQTSSVQAWYYIIKPLIISK